MLIYDEKFHHNLLPERGHAWKAATLNKLRREDGARAAWQPEGTA